MGRVVSLSPAALNMSMFGNQSNTVSNYLANQLSNMGSFAGSIGNRIYDVLQNSYNYVNDTMMQYNIRQELSKNDIAQFNYEYGFINSFRGLQEASMVMQRFIMAEPTIKQLYLDQNLDGYSGSYVNISGNEIGDNDYDYGLVNDGIVQIDEVNDTWRTVEYFTPLIQGDRRLNIMEQDDILHTWRTARQIMETCKYDFTKYNDDPDQLDKMNI